MVSVGDTRSRMAHLMDDRDSGCLHCHEKAGELKSARCSALVWRKPKKGEWVIGRHYGQVLFMKKDGMQAEAVILDPNFGKAFIAKYGEDKAAEDNPPGYSR